MTFQLDASYCCMIMYGFCYIIFQEKKGIKGIAYNGERKDRGKKKTETEDI